MKIYEQIRRITPDFFLHSGDDIYADGFISAEALQLCAMQLKTYCEDQRRAKRGNTRLEHGGLTGT